MVFFNDLRTRAQIGYYRNCEVGYWWSFLNKNRIVYMNDVWKIIYYMLFFLLLPVVAVCVESGSVRAGVQNTTPVASSDG